MINFSNVYALFGLITLPLILFIMKFYPPSPKKADFSSFFILKNIIKNNTAKTKFPLWLIIFRIILCFFIVLFFSKPFLIKSNQTEKYKNFVIIADNGWSIPSNLENYKNIIKEISLDAEKNKKEIHFYYSSSESFKKPIIFKSKNEIIDFLDKNPSLPKQIIRESFFKNLSINNYFKESKVFFIFSNLDSASIESQTKSLDLIKINNPSIQIINPIKKITFIEKLKVEKDKIKIKIRRKGPYIDNDFLIQFVGEKGDLILEKKYTFSKNSNEFDITEKFPLEVINQFFLIKIFNENHAAAFYYLDNFRKKIPVGIVAEENYAIEKPLLSSVYYLKKILNNSHLTFQGSINKLLKKNTSVIFLPSYKILLESEIKELKDWIYSGGVLIRFSDNKIIGQSDIFLDGEKDFISARRIGKELSFQNNLSIDSFKKNSIFSSLKVPKDLKFDKQLILDSFNSSIVTLASLEDQSPLITMKPVGEGKVILFHITSNNEWSNLPLSSLFEDLILKLLLISKTEKELPSKEMKIRYEINSTGVLASPKKNYYLNFNSNKKIFPSSDQPAGIYEDNKLSIALNLSGNLNTQGFFDSIDKEIKIKNNYKKSVIELKNFILCLVFIMFLIDMLINLILKKNILFLTFLKKGKHLSILFFLVIILFYGKNLEANERYTDLYLAYIKTDNKLLNQIAFSGLEELRINLIERTSLNPVGVKEVNIFEEELFYYPLIYWQIKNSKPKLSKEIINKINNYFDSGGIILFDVLDFSKSYSNINRNNIEEIKNLLTSYGIKNLQSIPKNHTLKKSYYLLNKYSGRWDNRILLIQNDNLETKDGVTSAIVGLNDWAGAWAKDKNNYHLFQAVPGGERQREISYRFGINLLMYSLTGNYKSDQVHSKSILERLKRK